MSIFLSPRFVCLIDDGNTVLVIGGSVSGCCYKGDVERFESTGKVETLPSLNINRNHHNCAKYHNADGEKVSFVAL